jgi:hypothetical protein
MTRWCIECAQTGQHQAAKKTIDGDPLCDLHAKSAQGSGAESEPAAPAPGKKTPGPYRKREKAVETPARSALIDAQVDTVASPAEWAGTKPIIVTTGGRVLWKARLRIQERKDEFLFRAGEEFSGASIIAADLLDSSPSCQMVGAVIVGIERVARLWN